MQFQWKTTSNQVGYICKTGTRGPRWLSEEKLVVELFGLVLVLEIKMVNKMFWKTTSNQPKPTKTNWNQPNQPSLSFNQAFLCPFNRSQTLQTETNQAFLCPVGAISQLLRCFKTVIEVIPHSDKSSDKLERNCVLQRETSDRVKL